MSSFLKDLKKDWWKNVLTGGLYTTTKYTIDGIRKYPREAAALAALAVGGAGLLAAPSAAGAAGGSTAALSSATPELAAAGNTAGAVGTTGSAGAAISSATPAAYNPLTAALANPPAWAQPIGQGTVLAPAAAPAAGQAGGAGLMKLAGDVAPFAAPVVGKMIAGSPDQPKQPTITNVQQQTMVPQKVTVGDTGAQSRGRRGTILTGGRGVTTAPTLGTRTLLG